MSKSSVLRLLALATVVAVILVSLTWATAELTGKSFNDAAKTVQALGTLAAIIAGGVFALYKLQVFRDFQPHLTITHEISHRRIGDSYVHLDVTVTLLNSSKTHVEVRRAYYVLQRITPVSDEEIESLYDAAFKVEDSPGIQWATLEVADRYWQHAELLVEPGESHPEAIEFIINSDIDSVLIYTYFYNSKHLKGSHSAEGWHATTVYDIMEEVERHDS